MSVTMRAFHRASTSVKGTLVRTGVADRNIQSYPAHRDWRRRIPRFLFPIILSIALAGIVFSAVAAEEVVQIRIIHRDVNEMLTIVQPLISQYGYISADVPSNSLIVIDNPEVVQRIHALVSRIDQPVAQLRIRVQYGYDNSRQGQSASVEGQVQVGDATI
ncbi:MAG: secretin N-terminal domain-containing protein, partial [Anaerolineales bacterium]